MASADRVLFQHQGGATSKEKRFEIHCPVTVGVSNGTNRKMEVSGMLESIGVAGATLRLAQPIVAGTKIELLVHFQNPNQQVTTVCFTGVVETLKEHPRFEVGVGFRGKGRFLQRQAGLHDVAPATTPEEMESKGL